MCACSDTAGSSGAGGKQPTKGRKQARTWEMNGGGKASAALDFSSKSGKGKTDSTVNGSRDHLDGFGVSAELADEAAYRTLVGRMEGELRDLDVPDDAPDAGADDEPDENEQVAADGADHKTQPKSAISAECFH